MSAWIVCREHIDVLVTALHPATQDEGDSLGRMLWRENLISVAYRYPDDKGAGDRPGPGDFRDWHVDAYTWTAREVPPCWVYQACGCYMYQSCEHDGWRESEACRLVRSLADRYKPFYRETVYNHSGEDGRTVYGPDNPPWGINEENLADLDRATVAASA